MQKSYTLCTLPYLHKHKAHWHIDTISLEKKKKMTLKFSLFAYSWPYNSEVQREHCFEKDGRFYLQHWENVRKVLFSLM